MVTAVVAAACVCVRVCVWLVWRVVARVWWWRLWWYCVCVRVLVCGGARVVVAEVVAACACVCAYSL